MQFRTLTLPAFDTLPIERSLLRDLRSNHAGETGAVYIYRGILRNTRHADVIDFARAHLSTERAHLRILEDWLPASCRSAFLPLWRASGWMLGALAARFGRTFTFATIEAVEQFVVAHYEAQILRTTGVLRELLLTLQDDEAAHRDDAARRLSAIRWRHKLWARVVHAGSAGAVHLARWM